MKALLISDKPKWCALMMNGYKTIEVRTSKALAKAIQKLIDENGYAEIYTYCSKINRKHYHLIESKDTYTGETEYEIDYYVGGGDYLDWCFDGKVAFKFRCYKVEEIDDWFHLAKDRFSKTCLSIHELIDYLKGKTGYAIHTSNLEIFDKPKELGEFMPAKWDKCGIKDKNGLYQCKKCPYGDKSLPACNYKSLTKAPQSYMFIEVEE